MEGTQKFHIGKDYVATGITQFDMYLLGGQGVLTARNFFSARNMYEGKGFIAGMPLILSARAEINKDCIRLYNELFDNDNTEKLMYTLAQEPIMSSSEEQVGKTRQGNTVLLITHGVGILDSDKNLLRAHKQGDEAREVPINNKEFWELLNGKDSKGDSFDVFTLKDLRGISNFPSRFGVVLDYETAVKSQNKYNTPERLDENELFVARAGSHKVAYRYGKMLSTQCPELGFENHPPYDTNKGLESAVLSLIVAGSMNINGLASSFIAYEKYPAGVTTSIFPTFDMERSWVIAAIEKSKLADLEKVPVC